MKFVKIFIIVFTFFYFNSLGQTSIKVNLNKGGSFFLKFPLSLYEGETITLYEVNKDTSFTIKINVDNPFDVSNRNKCITPYILFPNTEYFLNINKEDSILNFITQDSLKMAVANFFKNTEFENYKTDLRTDKIAGRIIFNNNIYTKKIDTFLLSVRLIRDKKIQNLFESKKITKEGSLALKLFNYFDIETYRLEPSFNSYFNKKKFPIWNVNSIINIEDYNEISYLNFSVFKKCVIYSNLFKTKTKILSPSLADEFDLAKTKQINDTIKNYLLYSILSKQSHFTSSNYKAYLDTFNIYCDNIQFIEDLRNNFNFRKKQHSTLDLLVSTKNKNLLFDVVIKKAKKIIVVDFWASWCIPCIAELERMHDINKRVINKNITFLFISIDENYSSWLKAVKKFSFMNGNNSYILKNGLNSNIAKKIKLDVIPRHSIFSNTGQINITDFKFDDLEKIINEVL